MIVHYNIRVMGRVQGVFFRVSTQKEAVRLGLAGYVKNEPDGTVYIEVEGQQDALDKLLTWIRLGGPPRGKVNNIEIEEGNLKNYKSFQIL